MKALPASDRLSPLRWLTVVGVTLLSLSTTTPSAPAAAAVNVPTFTLDARVIKLPVGVTATLVARFSRSVSGDVAFRLRGVPANTVLAAQRTGSRTYNILITPKSPGVFEAQLVTANPGPDRAVAIRLDVAPAPTATVPPVTAQPATLPPVTVAPTTPTTRPPAPPTPRFSVSVTAPQTAVLPGTQLALPVTVSRTNFDGPVFLNASGLPVNAQWNFAPNPTVASSVLYVTLPAGTPALAYPITVTGQASETVAATSFLLTVQGPGPTPAPPTGPAPAVPGTARFDVRGTSYPPGQALGFGLTTGNTVFAVRQGSSISFDVTVVPYGGFSGPIDIVVTGHPAGTRLTISNSGTNRFRIRFIADSLAVVGPGTLAISATANALSATIVRPFSVAAK